MNIESVMEHGQEKHPDLTVTLPVCCYREIIRQIALDVMETPVPEDMTWEERVGFMVAKTRLANNIRDNINAYL